MGLWAIGNFMVINIAGLQSVPTELYEAARIDGAGWWKSLRRITIPLISPVLLYDLVIVLIATFQYFTQAYTLTNGRGDPNNATLFINLELFREAFVFSRMGYGAAIAWLLFAIVLILTVILFALRPEARLLRRGRPMRVGTAARPANCALSRSKPGRPELPQVPRPGDDHDVRPDHRRRVPVAAAVHGDHLVPAAVADLDARRAALAGEARHGTFEGKEYPIYTVPIDGVDRQPDAGRARSPVERLRRSVRPDRRRRSSGRAAGGRCQQSWQFSPLVENYTTVWNQLNFPRLLFNTAGIAVLSTIGAVFSSILVAYGFARFRFPGRNLLLLHPARRRSSCRSRSRSSRST